MFIPFWPMFGPWYIYSWANEARAITTNRSTTVCGVCVEIIFRWLDCCQVTAGVWHSTVIIHCCGCAVATTATHRRLFAEFENKKKTVKKQLPTLRKQLNVSRDATQTATIDCYTMHAISLSPIIAELFSVFFFQPFLCRFDHTTFNIDIHNGNPFLPRIKFK